MDKKDYIYNPKEFRGKANRKEYDSFNLSVKSFAWGVVLGIVFIILFAAYQPTVFWDFIRIIHSQL